MDEVVECRTLRTFYNSHLDIQRRRTNEVFKAPLSIAIQLAEHGLVACPEAEKYLADAPKEEAPEEPLEQEPNHDPEAPIEEPTEEEQIEEPPPEEESKGGKKRGNRK